jgi:hypothetical protein
MGCDAVYYGRRLTRFHGGDYEECFHLGCDAVYFCRYVPVHMTVTNVPSKQGMQVCKPWCLLSSNWVGLGKLSLLFSILHVFLLIQIDYVLNQEKSAGVRQPLRGLACTA